MSQPLRPATSITYEQAVAYESSRTKWYNVHGHITNIRELSQIFNIPHGTLVMRLKAGWPLDTALLADKKQNWTINNIIYLHTQADTTDRVKAKLDAYFSKNKKRTKPNRVIGGGYF